MGKLKEHVGGIISIAITTNGEYIASGGNTV
jgi:hypothetical protein